MLAPDAIDVRAVIDDALAIAVAARSATSGWRALCVRERRRLGSKIIEPLSGLDLEDDVRSIAAPVREAARSFASDADTLLFGLFHGIDDGSVGYGGYYVSGIASCGRTAAELARVPRAVEKRFLRSHALDAIVAVSALTARMVRPQIEHALCFSAALLLSRFSAAGLPHRIVVGADEDDGPFVDVVTVPRRTRPTTIASAIPRLVQAC
jgi:hypothetical protein